MDVSAYLKALEKVYQRGNATEHTYRSLFQQFIEARSDGLVATNEPKREKCGAPDYVVSRAKDHLTLGYIEAKDLPSDLGEVEKSDQLKRYSQHLPNLLLTDYLEVRWFVHGEHGVEKRGTARLGRLASGGKIVSDSAEQSQALSLIDSFLGQRPVTISSPRDLAARLAHLTHLIRDIIVESFVQGEASQNLRDWRQAFAATLLPELSAQPDAKKESAACAEFADMFAQTLAYGLFSARVASPTGKFTRDLARRLIPRTNPFLRDFFEQITGSALEDEPFAGFVEDLIQTLSHTRTDLVLEDFGQHERRQDPIVHFYETFLQAYDPRLRELRGVYYTPAPVVNYIVESLDALLKSKFALQDGLADRSTVTTRREDGQEEETHRVLILDPATGTATFLYRVMDFIREQFERKKNAGAWGDYVHEHLLPRLFGFELLMAPYAVAHFKLGLALAAWDKEPLFRQQWSYTPAKDERINIFLTNTLEDLNNSVTELLGPARALSKEASDSRHVKLEKPVLVVLGNPPYSNFGQQNQGKWILGLLEDYKRGLKEKKINLNDDFIKFVRWAQWRVEQTGCGLIGMITNNVYLDGLTHRRMRECLLQTFDEIYIVNLHGSGGTRKQERAPDGGRDENVFDITLGVAIVIFVKLPKAHLRSHKSHAQVRYTDLWGARKKKYEWLDSHAINTTKWQKLRPASPSYYFVPKDVTGVKDYRRYWGLKDIFPVSNNGLKTDRDELFFDFDRHKLETRMSQFFVRDLPDRFREQYRIVDSSSYDIATRRHLGTYNRSAVRPCLYRPFDIRWLYYDPGLTSRPAEKVMRHLLAGENIALCCLRQSRRGEQGSYFVSDLLINKDAVSLFDIATVFPLYLYPNGKLPEDDLFLRETPEDEMRRPNFSADFIKDLEERLKVEFVREGLGQPKKRQVGPELIFHYAYAVFHSPGYRERYAEFLRADFPRLPVTRDWDLFRALASFGGRLVDLHAHGRADGSNISFPVKSDNVITDCRFQPAQSQGSDRHPGRVWINDLQYFEGIDSAVWDFPIGGYLPARRWLKDRRGRTLSYDDASAYPRLVAALGETRRLMAEIESTITTSGGWPKAFA